MNANTEVSQAWKHYTKCCIFKTLIYKVNKVCEAQFNITPKSICLVWSLRWSWVCVYHFIFIHCLIIFRHLHLTSLILMMPNKKRILWCRCNFLSRNTRGCCDWVEPHSSLTTNDFAHFITLSGCCFAIFVVFRCLPSLSHTHTYSYKHRSLGFQLLWPANTVNGQLVCIQN